jgi:uncharacterized protein with HEPN domain
LTAERDPVEALEDILQNMALAKEFAGAVRTINELEADLKTLYSVMRALEIVGEATKSVPPYVRALDSTIPWKEMAGMRDKLIHAYETVDVEILLKTVREDIPTAEPRKRELLNRLVEAARE